MDVWIKKQSYLIPAAIALGFNGNETLLLDVCLRSIHFTRDQKLHGKTFTDGNECLRIESGSPKNKTIGFSKRELQSINKFNV